MSICEPADILRGRLAAFDESPTLFLKLMIDAGAPLDRGVNDSLRNEARNACDEDRAEQPANDNLQP